MEHLRTFGCVAHVKTVGGHIGKLEDRSTPMVLVGYEPGSKAYRVYDPRGRMLRVTRDVVFEEAKAWNWDSSTKPAPHSSGDIFNVFDDRHNAGYGEHNHDHGDEGEAPSTPVVQGSVPEFADLGSPSTPS